MAALRAARAHAFDRDRLRTRLDQPNPLVQDADIATIMSTMMLIGPFAVFAASYLVVTRVCDRRESVVLPRSVEPTSWVPLVLLIGVASRMMLRRR
jgi:hypothetical protein